MTLLDPRAIRIRFWGVRGSCPSPGPDTAGVGGNTSCVEVCLGSQRVVLDGGTGLRELGRTLSGPVQMTLLFSHVHWDHIQGVPFFAPLFDPASELTVVGATGSGSCASIREALDRQMTGPNFPVDLGQVAAQLRFVEVEPGEPFELGGLRVRAAALNHPNGVMAYRLEAGGRSLVYATDTEHYPDRVDESLVELARDADVLIYDAQYTPGEYSGCGGCARVGWGHSTWLEGVRVARAARVGRLVLFHHDPTHDDQTVAEIERSAAEQLPGTIAAREGLELALPIDADRRRKHARADSVPSL